MKMTWEMKESGIEWIGEIPKDWEVLRHKYLMRKRKTLCDKYQGEDIISLTMKGVIIRDLVNPTGKMPASFDGYQYVQAGNLLLCLFDIDVTPRCVGVIRNDGLTSPAYSQFLLLDNDSVDYYYYLLLTIDNNKSFLHLSKNLRSSLTESDFGNILTIRPTIDIQHRIADYLDTKCSEIDAMVEKTKATIEEYKKLKQSIITEAVTKGLDKTVPMKDSGVAWIGAIPEHWKITKIGRFVSLRSGFTLGKQYPPNTSLVELPYLRVANVKADRLALDNVAMINVSQADAEKYALKSGELLMTEGGDRDKLGRGTIWRGEIENCLHQNHIYAVTVNHHWMLTEFLEYLTASSVGREYFDFTAKKTTNLASTNSTTVLKFKVPIPSIEEQSQIIKVLNMQCAEIDTLIAKKQIIASELERYKKSLIYECVTGKREV